MSLSRSVLAALLASGAILLSACAEETATPIADASVQDIDADYIVWGMDNQLTLNGVRNGHVLADSAWGVRDSAVVYMRGVTMTLFDDQGLDRARVTSEEGVFNQRTEELMAYGDVLLEVSDQGVRIESSMLGYDPLRDEIWSDSVTSAQINGSRTDGTCFRSDLQFEGWSVCDPRGQIPRRPPGADAAGTRRPPSTPRGSGANLRGGTAASADTSGAGAATGDTTRVSPDSAHSSPPADTTTGRVR